MKLGIFLNAYILNAYILRHFKGFVGTALYHVSQIVYSE